MPDEITAQELDDAFGRSPRVSYNGPVYYHALVTFIRELPQLAGPALDELVDPLSFARLSQLFAQAVYDSALDSIDMLPATKKRALEVLEQTAQMWDTFGSERRNPQRKADVSDSEFMLSISMSLNQINQELYRRRQLTLRQLIRTQPDLFAPELLR